MLDVVVERSLVVYSPQSEGECISQILNKRDELSRIYVVVSIGC